VRDRGVRIAITCLRWACRTAEPERFEMLRIADRPATHAWAQLHKFDGNRRGERRGTLATYPIGYDVGCVPLPTAEPAIACESYDRLGDLGHF
jgi:hypothetical protein